jgi:hypothetical protein
VRDSGPSPNLYLSSPPARRFNNKIDVDIEKVGVKTIVIPPVAYNSYDDLILVLQTGMKSASPKLGKSKVLFDRDSLTFTFESNGPEFRFLWATGPNKNEKAGPSLGFKNEDTEFDDEHKGFCMSLDLNMMLTADQVTIFTVELAKEFDDSFNNFVEFSEFVRMYVRATREASASLGAGCGGLLRRGG